MQPLAYRLRPKSLDLFVGQNRILGDSAPLRLIIESGNIPSMIFWGPPGTGKTTTAEIIANSTAISTEFYRLSAVTDGKDALKKIIDKAEQNQHYNKKTILFIDEIHRWNKAQQDSLLAYVEAGIVTIIGATTENPSFSIISPLLSRTKTFIFESHTEEDIEEIINRGAKKLNVKIGKDAIKSIANIANGDLRFALNTLDLAAQLSNDKKITRELLEQTVQKHLHYDKTGEEHYNLISAVHKSLRSSNATAAVYWITRMLEAGEDPLYIARRLIRFASEDIGNAQPNALLLANVVFDTCKKIGMPECAVSIIQLAEYLANSPKSNAAYKAYSLAIKDVKEYGNLPVPMHLRNAPTKFMKDIGYGKGYEYDHKLKSKKSNQQTLPDKIVGKNYFED